VQSDPSTLPPAPGTGWRRFLTEVAASWPGMLGSALACFAAGSAGIIFTGTDHFFSPIWPLSGVAVGCLLLGGPAMVPGVYAGVAAHNALWGMNALTTWAGAGGIVFEALAAYGILALLLGPRPRLTNLRGCFAFLLAAPWLPAAANGVFGLGLLYAEATAGPSAWAREWPLFVMANGGAIALLAPAFAVAGPPPDAAWWRRLAFWGPFCLLSAGLVFFGTFALPPHLLFVPMLASAVVLGLRGAAPLTALVAVVAALAVLRGGGGFTMTAQSPGVPLQFYTLLLSLAFCTLSTAAVVDHYRRRLQRAASAAGSAGLTFWSWDRTGGTRLDRIDEGCLLGDATTAAPGGDATLFEGAADRGVRETEAGGAPALSFWVVTQRDSAGRAEAADGILLDLAERLSLEQARRRAWQSEIELRNLRAGLAPHLLFNCLAAVRGFVRTDPERARSFIDHLSRFLRDSTNAQHRETVPLLDEWQLCEDFLALQGMRYERDLPRLVEIEGSAYHARLPPMMLLNLVENAVKHGEISQRHPLVAAARLDGPLLEVNVRNRGRLGTRPADRPGGLGISLARLQAIYGSRASLDIRADGENVVATLRVPASPAPPAAHP
jgi:integral membrane sensor domain MASE1